MVENIPFTRINWRPINEYPYGTKWAQAFMVLCAHEQHGWIRFGRYYPEVGKWYYSGTSERSQWAQVEGDEPTHWAPMLMRPGES